MKKVLLFIATVFALLTLSGCMGGDSTYYNYATDALKDSWVGENEERELIARAMRERGFFGNNKYYSETMDAKMIEMFDNLCAKLSKEIEKDTYKQVLNGAGFYGGYVQFDYALLGNQASDPNGVIKKKTIRIDY